MSTQRLDPDIDRDLFRPLTNAAPRHRIVPNAQGAGVTVHIVDGHPTATGLQYRFERGQWESRQGYGEPWRSCARPDLPDATLQKLEAA